MVCGFWGKICPALEGKNFGKSWEIAPQCPDWNQKVIERLMTSETNGRSRFLKLAYVVENVTVNEVKQRLEVFLSYLKSEYRGGGIRKANVLL